MDELLNCPFCGGEPDVACAVGEFWVLCSVCEASARMSSDKTVAVTAWNTRAPPEPKAEPVAWKCDALISMDPDDVEYWTTKGFPVTPLFAHPPAPPEGWQPIETAPTDRHMVMLIARYPISTVWSDIQNGWRNSDGDWVRWRHNFPPTHWMPIPALPAPETP